LRHNWNEVKFFEIHPFVCRQALEFLKQNPLARKQDEKSMKKFLKEQSQQSRDKSSETDNEISFAMSEGTTEKNDSSTLTATSKKRRAYF
jgi:hypothetical protein